MKNKLAFGAQGITVVYPCGEFKEEAFKTLTHNLGEQFPHIIVTQLSLADREKIAQGIPKGRVVAVIEVSDTHPLQDTVKALTKFENWEDKYFLIVGDRDMCDMLSLQKN